jgi:hypothetical protein
VYSVWSVVCGVVVVIMAAEGWTDVNAGLGDCPRRLLNSLVVLTCTLHQLLHLASSLHHSAIYHIHHHPSFQSKDNLPTPCPRPNNSGPPPNSRPPPNNSGPPNLECLLTTTFAPNGFPYCTSLVPHLSLANSLHPFRGPGCQVLVPRGSVGHESRCQGFEIY